MDLKDLTFPDLSSVNTIAFDTETSGLDPHTDRPVGYVLTWGFRPEESRYFPIRHEGGGNLEEGPVIDFGRRTLARTDLRVVMHHAAFDLWMAGKDGIEINGAIEDTGLNDPLINENNKKYSLAACCERADAHVVAATRLIVDRINELDALIKVGVIAPAPGHAMTTVQERDHLAYLRRRVRRIEAKKGERMYAYLAERFGGEANRDQMSNYWRLPGTDDLAHEYAAGDGTSTLQLWDWQQVRIEEQDLGRVHDVECRLIPVLHRARARGVTIDEKTLDEVDTQITEMGKKAIDDIHGMNPRAPSEVGKYLKDLATNFGEHDWDASIVPKPPRTKPSKRFPEGQDSFNSKYLEGFPAGAELTRARKITHLKSSFIDPMRERHLHNGMLYPTFHQLASDDYGTVTGRLSSSGPNLQQVPKRNKELGRIFRRVFNAPEGHSIWEMDYSQCEYRLFAHFSQSQKLIDGYNKEGIDMHLMVAGLLNLSRDLAKNMNFGMLYGMGSKSLAGHLGVTKGKAEALRSEYLSRIPEAARFMKQAGDIARQRGFVRTLLGRRRRYTDPNGQSYQAINSICQGGNADIVKIKMVEVDDYLRSSGRGDFCFSVHDALVTYLDDSQKPAETSAEIMRICERFTKEEHGFDLRVGMELDEGHGPNWSIASYGEAA